MSPTWYDLLGVGPSADADEVRAAWKTSIADLDPSDRRFRLCNQAAEVLLDPQARAEYDAELAPARSEPTAVPSPAPSAAPVDLEKHTDDHTDDDQIHTDRTQPAAEPHPFVPSAPADEADPATEVSARAPAAVLAWASGLVAALLIVVTVVAVIATSGSDPADASPSADAGSGKDAGSGALPDDKEIAAARAAAEEAVVPVLSYDYRTLDQDQVEARSYLTKAYASEYDQFFTSAVLTNAPRTRTVVRVRVLDSATVRTGPDRVDVLVFVNRPTVNKRATEPVEYHDQVTMRMVHQGDTWLVGCMITAPGTPCPT